MRIFLYAVLFFCELSAVAQPNSVGFLGTLSTGSKSSGNTGAVGGCVEVTHDLNTDLVILSGNACYDTGNKGYVGDGHNIRWRAEGAFYIQHRAASIRPFLLAGVNYARQSNSQYSKGILNPYFGAGLNWRDRAILYAEYLMPEHGTLNNVSAIRYGGYYIYPFAPRWSIKAGGEVTSVKFTQPNGAAKGVYRSNSFQMFAGVLWMRNPVASSLPVTSGVDTIRTMPSGMAQGYLSDYGEYRINFPMGVL